MKLALNRLEERRNMAWACGEQRGSSGGHCKQNGTAESRTGKEQSTYLFKVAALLRESRKARFADGGSQGLGHGRGGRGTPLGHKRERVLAKVDGREKAGKRRGLIGETVSRIWVCGNGGQNGRRGTRFGLRGGNESRSGILGSRFRHRLFRLTVSWIWVVEGENRPNWVARKLN